MQAVVFTWIDLILNAIEATTLGALVGSSFSCGGHTMAMLRVLRRIDRKTSEPAAGRLAKSF
jgi:hypothetical protein